MRKIHISRFMVEITTSMSLVFQRQQVRDTNQPISRRYAASDARTALKALAERALDLHIATVEEFDRFLLDLRIENRWDSSS